MKHLIVILLFGVITTSKAQHVKVQLNFPSGIAIRPSGPAPFAGAIWIGPEWYWDHGRYVHRNGYWCKPHHGKRQWIPGHWKYTRRGYVWIGGRWR